MRTSRVVMAVRFGAAALPSALATSLGASRHEDGDTPSQAGQGLSTRGAWLARSWVRLPHDPYPDYETMWSELSADLAAVDAWHASADAPRPAITEFELRYVNPITGEEEWERRRDFERLLLNALGRQLSGDFLPDAGEVVTDARFPMAKADGGPQGQLNVTVRCVASEGPEAVLGVTLCARGRVVGGEADALRASFDAALGWVVRGFASFAPPLPTGR